MSSSRHGQYPEEVAQLLHAALEQLNEIGCPPGKGNDPELLLAMQTVDQLFDGAMRFDRQAFPPGWFDDINDARYYINAVGINAELLAIAQKKLRKALGELNAYWAE